ncbi:Phospholipase D-like domain [Trinorchestia longiramus]|nr:Phospholipase D-like domain [Trinorchestia longiramus]
MEFSQLLPPAMKWLATAAPAFPVHSEKIEIITEPRHFYNTLLERTSLAKKRITFASLYLGSGKLEQELVLCMQKRLTTTPELEVLWLIDWTRGSRTPASSRQTLLPLLQHSSCQISLFHTPELRGLLKLLLPQRWNEIIALQHMKLYIFDDSLLISGANLSADYFTNRQDRYFLISGVPELSDFFHAVVRTVSRHSLLLLKDGSTALHPYAPRHPVQDSYQSYCSAVEADVRAVWDAAVHQSALRHSASSAAQGLDSASSNEHLTPDTVVFPSLQMRSFNINYDARMTERLLQSAGPDSVVHLASGYFNLTRAYMKCLLQAAAARFSVLCAHPKANGFLGAAGVAGAIPAAYTLLAKQFLGRVQQLGQQSRVQLYEYQRNNWTFHAKGLWYSEHSYSDLISHGTSEDQCLPCLTLIGSPNFGWRSVHRDLESQIVVVTSSPLLQQRLARERDLLYQRASLVDLHSTYAQPSRRVQFWVRFVVPLIKRFF